MNMQVYKYTHKHSETCVLDVGCGNGSAIRLYAGKNFQTIARGSGTLHYVGLDLDSKEINKANEAWASGRYAKKISCLFYVQDITASLVVGPRTQHVIWCMETIEHVPLTKAPLVLALMYEALHPDGRLILSTPAPLGTELVWPDSHDHEFNRHETELMLREAGFKIEDMWGVGCNMRHAKKLLTPERLDMYNKLRLRINPHVAGTVMQALYPEMADDLLWVCTKR